ncbi:MAG TPA: hypothetical protein VKY73_14995 [Polyangiaceae bacterium]|nr:hypothetical protein [Polyangiaceae bacterium]
MALSVALFALPVACGDDDESYTGPLTGGTAGTPGSGGKSESGGTANGGSGTGGSTGGNGAAGSTSEGGSGGAVSPAEGGSAGDPMTGSAGEGATVGSGGDANGLAGAGGDDGNGLAGAGGAPVEGGAGAGGDGATTEPTLEELAAEVCTKEPEGEACEDDDDCETRFVEAYTLFGSCTDMPESHALLACFAALDSDAFTCDVVGLTAPGKDDACTEEYCAWLAECAGYPCE